MCTAKIVSAKDLQIGSSSPDVSVVVPAFNYAHFLAECIESLSIQSLVTWECIVVDDASTDDTHSILLELAAREPRLRTIFQSTNQGPSAARNQGLAVARRNPRGGPPTLRSTAAAHNISYSCKNVFYNIGTNNGFCRHNAKVFLNGFAFNSIGSGK